MGLRMAKRPKEPGGHSRRQVFKLAGVASVLGAGSLAQSQGAAATQQNLEALETLTAGEANILEAFCARLIPSDANGPGANEARAAHYIDRALGGALASAREIYRSGLMALDAHAQASKGAPFNRLDAQMQDSGLIDFEKTDPTFFNLVRQHTLQGTFCDPYYGGNANFV